MTMEYYVKKRLPRGNSQLIETCETPEQAQRQLRLYNGIRSESEYYIQYSPHALQAFIEEGQRRFGNG